jgi:uncharacterized membrane protein (DUF373 family)
VEGNPMHKFDTAYELFESLVSRLVMLVLSFLTLYALGAAGIELIADMRLGSEFIEKELLQDTFGSILTVLILLEFTHSVYTSVKKRSVVIEARAIVLIAVIVVARKLILVDFKSATLEQIAAFGGIALSLGVLYWLLGAAADRKHDAARLPHV